MSPTGRVINGRYYTRHALERMAPSTPEVLAELELRAIKKGLQRGTPPFKDYIDARNIPPSVVEETIKNGVKTVDKKNPLNWKYQTMEATVITNQAGDVVSAIPEGIKSKL